MLQLTKRYPFSASHRLHSTKLDAAENVIQFGKCNNPHGHGHNYTLEVTVSGQTNSPAGMIISRLKLDEIVERHVLSEINHVDLNSAIEDFRHTVPTTENLALLISDRLKKFWVQELGDTSPHLIRVRVAETARNSCEVTV